MLFRSTTRGDLLVGTSGAPTGTRLGIGASTYVMTSDGTDAAWAAAGGGGATKKYTATLANVLNTTTETVIISWTIGADEWADGEVLYLNYSMLAKNNAGDQFEAFKVYFGSENFQVNMLNGTAPYTSGNANEKRWMYAHQFMRVGSEIWGFCGGPPPYENTDWEDFNMVGQVARDNGARGGHWVSVVASSSDFTSSLACSIKVTLTAADATFYVKPQTCSIIKYQGSAA